MSVLSQPQQQHNTTTTQPQHCSKGYQRRFGQKSKLYILFKPFPNLNQLDIVILCFLLSRVIYHMKLGHSNKEREFWKFWGALLLLQSPTPFDLFMCLSGGFVGYLGVGRGRGEGVIS